MFACVKAPGSCGELVQGTIDGRNFLLTCPIDLYSTATVIRNPQTSFIKAGPKASLAIAKTLDYLKLPAGEFQITVQSDLPQGKGMASSSADISAACQAVALSAGRLLTLDEIAAIAVSIEPTDGVFLPGIALFDHITAATSRCLGEPPPITIAVFDGGGEVDTLYFNRRADLQRLNAAKEKQVRQALELVSQGLQQKDAGLLGRGATLSAVANQAILPKPCLPAILPIAQSCGAVGVNIAHSGTVLGIMFKTGALEHYEECLTKIRRTCPELRFIKTVQLISGGLRIAGDHHG